MQANARFVDRPVRADWGSSDFELRHQLVFSYLYELPFGRSRRFLNQANRALSAMVSGWSLSGLGIVRGGDPLYLRLGRDVDGDGDISRDRPALLRGSLKELYAAGAHGKTQWLVPLAEASTRLGNPANAADPASFLPRNVLRSPGAINFDLSLNRRFVVREGWTLGLEVNGFNVWNRANFAAPVNVLTDARFGRITATRGGFNPRQIQLGLRMTF